MQVKANALTPLQELEANLFAASLFPYLGFIYYLRKARSPTLLRYGFTFLLVFVGGSIPAAILAMTQCVLPLNILMCNPLFSIIIPLECLLCLHLIYMLDRLGRIRRLKEPSIGSCSQTSKAVFVTISINTISSLNIDVISRWCVSFTLAGIEVCVTCQS